MKQQEAGMLASAVIEDSMREYAEYTLAEQLPNPVDGLKLIHRRILWVMRKSDKIVKMFNVIGQVMQIHPHGDASVGDAMHALMQPFNNVYPLIYSDGNVGSYGGDSPAAARYLDIGRAEFTMDVFFRDTNPKIYDYVKTETDSGWEPRYLIPKIPTALLTATFGLPVAFKVSIHPFYINSVFAMVKAYANNPSQSPSELLKKHPDWLYPDSFVPSLLRNVPQLNDSIKRGIFTTTTTYDGVMNVGSKDITIRSLPFGVSPVNIYEKMFHAVRDKNDILYKYVQAVKDLSKQSEYYLMFVLKRGVDPFQAMDAIKKKIKFTSTHHPCMRWVSPEGKLLEYDVDKILSTWYDARYRGLLSELKHKQTHCVQEVRKCEARVVVAENVDAVVKLLKDAPTKDAAVRMLMSTYELTRMQAEYLTTLSLLTIQKASRDEILKETEILKQELRNLKTDFATIPQKIIDSVTVLEKKYSRERYAKLPQFCGVLKTSTGYVQFWNESEQHSLLLDHGPEDVQVQYYPKGRLYKYAVKDGRVIDESTMHMAKEDRVDKFIISPHKLHSTLVIVGKTMFRRSELVANHPKGHRYRFVADRFSCITNSGIFKVRNTTEIPLLRGKLVTGGGLEVQYISHIVSTDPMVLIHMNSRETNTIRADVVQDGALINKLSIGKWEVIGLFALDAPFIVNIPSNMLSRNKTYQLYIPDIAAILDGRRSMKIYVGKTSPCETGTITKSKHGMMQLVKK